MSDWRELLQAAVQRSGGRGQMLHVNNIVGRDGYGARAGAPPSQWVLGGRSLGTWSQTGCRGPEHTGRRCPVWPPADCVIWCNALAFPEPQLLVCRLSLATPTRAPHRRGDGSVKEPARAPSKCTGAVRGFVVTTGLGLADDGPRTESGLLPVTGTQLQALMCRLGRLLRHWPQNVDCLSFG